MWVLTEQFPIILRIKFSKMSGTESGVYSPVLSGATDGFFVFIPQFQALLGRVLSGEHGIVQHNRASCFMNYSAIHGPNRKPLGVGEGRIPAKGKEDRSISLMERLVDIFIRNERLARGVLTLSPAYPDQHQAPERRCMVTPCIFPSLP